MNNAIRLISILIFPLTLAVCFFFVFRIQKYRSSLKINLRKIIINTMIFMAVISIGIIVYFKIEDTIYCYDYAGHYIRSLTLRKTFFENPADIFSLVYNSMNYNDYSYLPALFGLPVIILNTSYGFFCLGTFLYFIVSTAFLLNVLYFSLTDRYPYMPAIALLVFYPLYLCIFQGEIDGIGLFYLTVIYMLIFFRNFEEISLGDNLIINLCAFLLIFLRRWYLYSLVSFYLSYFVKYLFYYGFRPFSKKGGTDFIRIISSGLVMLVAVVLFFRPFLNGVLTNTFAESYAYYNHDGKLYSFINFYSILILAVCALGLIKLFKEDWKLALILLIMTIVPTLMFCTIQSLERHHYYMVTLNILILFGYGLYNLLSINRIVCCLVTAVLLAQSVAVFAVPNEMPIFTSIRKLPEIRKDKNEITDLTVFLKSILTEDWQSAYIASGSSYFNDDIIRNAILPDISAPQIDSAVFDIRDGFPRDFKYISYFIICDPIQYLDEDYQHMYNIITDVVTKHPEFSKEFTSVFETTVDGNIKVSIYERTGNVTDEMMEYCYEEMMKYYPDKADYFKYMVEN